MKKWIGIALVLMLAVPAMAQFAGLPIAGGAGLATPSSFNASGGIVLSDDFNTYGVRGAFAVMENLTLFGDAGALDPDEGDMGWAIQGGGVFTLPLQDLPVDVGIRGALGYAGYDMDGGDATMMDFMAGVLASKSIDQFTPYAFLGFNYLKWEVDVDGPYGKVDDDETDLAIAGGCEFALTEQFSIYGELAHIDDLFFGLGGRMRF